MKNFLAYQAALEATRRLRVPLEQIARRDHDLEKQMRRAMSSTVLNLAEGNRRRGQDRLHIFRIAAGSAAEVQAGLALAEAWAYLGAATAAPPAQSLDEVLRMLWRLTERSH